MEKRPSWQKIASSIFCVILAFFCTLALTRDYQGKKILFINSYHRGYQHSDSELRGVEKNLAGTGIRLKVVYMDTKRNASEQYAQRKALEVKETIAAFEPDIVISADDSAFKYVIQPYYRDSDLPIVFCGINWDVSVYGAPYINTTGVLEMNLVGQLCQNLKRFAKGVRVGVLSYDHYGERKHVSYLSKYVKGELVATLFVKDFISWKENFLQLQDKVDMIIFTNTSGIAGWDEPEAERFVREHIRVPTGTGTTSLASIALLTLAHIPEEQGELAAAIALKILDGTKPNEIPVAVNKKGDLYLNFILAERLGIVFPPKLIRNAKGIYGFVEE